MDDRELNSFFEKKLDEMNLKQRVERLERNQKDFMENEFKIFKENDFKELKEATTENCPLCRTLVSKHAKHCTNEKCNAEFE